MRADEVPDELVWAAEAAQAKVPLGPGCEGRLLRAALAAVIPLVQAEEREAIINGPLGHVNDWGAEEHDRMVAAIRARNTP